MKKLSQNKSDFYLDKCKNINYDSHLLQLVNKQLLPVLDNVMGINDFNTNEYYTVSINDSKIINQTYIMLTLLICKINPAIDEEDPGQQILVVLHDNKPINDKLQKIIQNISIMKAYINYAIAQYNIQEKQIGTYQLISLFFPRFNEYNKFSMNFKNILNNFVHNVIGPVLIENFQKTPYYNEHQNEIESQVLHLRLFDPQLKLGEYPQEWYSRLSIKANLVDNNNQVIYQQQINSSNINFVNFECMNWFYSKYAYDFTEEHWKQVMQQYFDTLVDTNLTYISYDNIVKIKLLSYNSLSEKTQFLLSDDPQKIANVQRLLQLLQTGFLNDLIINYKFDQNNNLLFLTLNDVSENNDDVHILVCGPNGIILKDWKHYIYKPGVNNLNDAKQTLEKLLNLPININYHKEFHSYQELLQNEVLLIIDAYNKRYTLNGLESLAKFSAMKIKNIQALQQQRR